jgi:methyl-accepting chemotaxis protein
MKTLSLKAKLFSLTLAIATGLLLVGGVGLYALNQVSSRYEHIAQVNLRKIEYLSLLRVHFRQTRIELRTLGIQGISHEEVNRVYAAVPEAIENYHKAEEQYQAVPFSEGERELFDKVHSQWEDFKKVGERILTLKKSNSPQDQEKLLSIFFKDCPEGAARYKAVLDELVKYQTEQADQWVNSASATANECRVLTGALVIGGFLFALALGYFFSKTLASQINQSIDSLKSEAKKIAEVSHEVSTASQQLSQSVQEQAASLHETAASVAEMTAMISKNADNAQASAEIANASHDKANQGFSSVSELTEAINEINQSNTEIMNQIAKSNQEMAELVKIITDIGDKTKIINDIVFQTKLLSFNASVEAARAGEHGKGFAVVAEEIGNLASMSGNAALEISQMLQESSKKVESTVERTQSEVNRLIQSGRTKVESATAMASGCGVILKELVENVQTVNRRVIEISTASKEQGLGVQEINRAMNELNTVTSQNTQTSEQTAASAEQLMSQVTSLHQIISKMNRLVTGQELQKQQTREVKDTELTLA